MLGNLALAVVSFLSVSSFTSSLTPVRTHYVSPLPAIKRITTNTPIKKVLPTNTATHIPTTTLPTSSPLPTSTPTPIPTEIPVPSPTPTIPVEITTGDVEEFFGKYSSQFGVDPELLKRIANCESSFNPNARNLDYGGMYQFSEESWISTRIGMGQNTDPALRFNAEESIKTAAYKLSLPNGANAWPSCH